MLEKSKKLLNRHVSSLSGLLEKPLDLLKKECITGERMDAENIRLKSGLIIPKNYYDFQAFLLNKEYYFLQSFKSLVDVVVNETYKNKLFPFVLRTFHDQRKIISIVFQTDDDCEKDEICKSIILVDLAAFNDPRHRQEFSRFYQKYNIAFAKNKEIQKVAAIIAKDQYVPQNNIAKLRRNVQSRINSYWDNKIVKFSWERQNLEQQRHVVNTYSHSLHGNSPLYLGMMLREVNRELLFYVTIVDTLTGIVARVVEWVNEKHNAGLDPVVVSQFQNKETWEAFKEIKEV